MALVPVIAQSLPATFGGDTPFILSVQNTGGTNVTVNSVQLFISSPTGQSSGALPYNISQPVISPASGGGGSAAVVITASSTSYFPFSCQFFGFLYGGGPAQAVPQFLLTAQVTDSTGAISLSPGFEVTLSQPTLGQPGSPPAPSVAVGQLNFSVPASSNLLL
jgi:hypothetical protein